MKGSTKATTPAAYLAALPEDRRAELEQLDAAIRKAVPKFERKMWGEVIGYGGYHYRYPSGREGDWFVIGLCSRKSYISLYVSVADEEGYLAERSKDLLGKVKVGKSCITFKRLEDLDLRALGTLLKKAAVMAKAGHGAQ